MSVGRRREMKMREVEVDKVYAVELAKIGFSVCWSLF